jgi:hypothetical protein
LGSCSGSDESDESQKADASQVYEHNRREAVPAELYEVYLQASFAYRASVPAHHSHSQGDNHA